jgi:hypothetical protein
MLAAMGSDPANDLSPAASANVTVIMMKKWA